MPLHLIRVIREHTDTVTQTTDSLRTHFCSGMKLPDKAFWEPETDIFETEDEVVIKLALAGIKKEDLCVKIKNGNLKISGLRREDRPSSQLYFHQLEISYGPFEKDISIPSSIEHNEIKAHLGEGVLIINISKKNETIEIPYWR